jgi:hypothetical protein
LIAFDTVLESLVTLLTVLTITTNPLTYPASLPQDLSKQENVSAVEKKTDEGNVAYAQEKPSMDYSGEGHDISWPNCDVDVPQKDFGIVGVNYGSPFTYNPCFTQQYKWATEKTSSPSLYMNLDLNPSRLSEIGANGAYGDCGDDKDCQAKNYGYNAAKDAHEHAESNGASSPKMWWLDVEPLNIWSSDPIFNRNSIDGAVRYFNEHNENVGVYSTPMLWKDITGDYKNGLPVWPAILDSTPQTACGTGFTGGETLIVQYNQVHLDKNFAC